MLYPLAMLSMPYGKNACPNQGHTSVRFFERYEQAESGPFGVVFLLITTCSRYVTVRGVARLFPGEKEFIPRFLHQ